MGRFALGVGSPAAVLSALETTTPQALGGPYRSRIREVLAFRNYIMRISGASGVLCRKPLKTCNGWQTLSGATNSIKPFAIAMAPLQNDLNARSMSDAERTLLLEISWNAIGLNGSAWQQAHIEADADRRRTCYPS